jgi:subtilisin family serine protease
MKSGYEISMNIDERYKITSNDYADLLINHHNDTAAFNNFPPGAINYIDSNYAVLHIPAEELTVNSLSKFGYPAIPCCYSLQSTPYHIEAPLSCTSKDPQNSLTGRGILIGVVDTGIDYLSPLFQTSFKTTRILTIWDQTIESANNYPSDFYYGTEFSEEQINLAIESDNPHDIVPSIDEIGHGTMIAGIAGGSELSEFGYSGVSNQSEFLIVKLKEAKENLKDFLCIPNDAIAYQENDIMMGVSYLIRYAAKLNRAISILIGVGTSQGDHGGRGYLSSFLTYYSNFYGIVISVPAGNESNRGHHVYSKINPSIGFENVELSVGAHEQGFLLEIYGIPPSDFGIEIITPTNEYLGRITPSLGGDRTIQIFYRNTSVIIDNQIKEDYRTVEQVIVVRFRNPIAGTWRFLISSESDLTAQFHFWLPTEAFIEKSTYFFHPNNNTTITSPGNAERPITVTAYNPTNQTLYFYASKGNTVLDSPKPDITAPGVDIIVPVNSSVSFSSSGTSLATAYIAGMAALLLQWGIIDGNNLYINGTQVKKSLTLGAKRDPNLDYPNPDWGYGIADLEKTLVGLQQDIGGNTYPWQKNVIPNTD